MRVPQEDIPPESGKHPAGRRRDEEVLAVVVTLSRVFLAALVAALLALPAWSQEAPVRPDLAILIVGDEDNAEMLRQEKALIHEIARLRARQEQPVVLPILSYHFNKERERAYCERKLNILKEDLVFVGIVRLEKKVPRKVLYRLDRIVRPSRAAEDVLARAEEMLPPPLTMVQGSPAPAEETPSSEEAAGTTTPQETPVAGETAGAEGTPPAASEEEGPWFIQAGSFANRANAEERAGTLQGKGYEARIVRTQWEGTVLYRVQVGNYATRQEALEALERLHAEGFQEAYIAPLKG